MRVNLGPYHACLTVQPQVSAAVFNPTEFATVINKSGTSLIGAAEVHITCNKPVQSILDKYLL